MPKRTPKPTVKKKTSRTAKSTANQKPTKPAKPTKTTPQLDAVMASLESEWKLSRDREPVLAPYELPPGIHLGISFADYCRIPGINQSSLAAMKISPAHYRYAPRSESTPALQFGTIFHEGHLEPDLLARRYIVVPEETFVANTQTWRKSQGEDPYASPKATSHYKQQVADFLRIHPGKQQVSLAWFTDLAHMLKQLNSNETAASLFTDGFPEVTIIWDDPATGLRCKGRIDWVSLSEKCLVDLKSTEDSMNWVLDKWNYHMQAAFYLDGYAQAHYASGKDNKQFPRGLRNFHFVVCEKHAPHSCRVACPSFNALVHGRSEYNYLLNLIDHCTKQERWPQPPNPACWDVSRWFSRYDFPTATDAEHYGLISPTPTFQTDDD